jgi:hypothetical protein
MFSKMTITFSGRSRKTQNTQNFIQKMIFQSIHKINYSHEEVSVNPGVANLMADGASAGWGSNADSRGWTLPTPTL